MARLSRGYSKLNRCGNPGLFPQAGRTRARVLETTGQALQAASAETQERATAKVSTLGFVFDIYTTALVLGFALLFLSPFPTVNGHRRPSQRFVSCAPWVAMQRCR